MKIVEAGVHYEITETPYVGDCQVILRGVCRHCGKTMETGKGGTERTIRKALAQHLEAKHGEILS